MSVSNFPSDRPARWQSVKHNAIHSIRLVSCSSITFFFHKQLYVVITPWVSDDFMNVALFHLRARFLFTIAKLSWVERKAASLLYSELTLRASPTNFWAIYEHPPAALMRRDPDSHGEVCDQMIVDELLRQLKKTARESPALPVKKKKVILLELIFVRKKQL